MSIKTGVIIRDGSAVDAFKWLKVKCLLHTTRFLTVHILSSYGRVSEIIKVKAATAELWATQMTAILLSTQSPFCEL